MKRLFSPMALAIAFGVTLVPGANGHGNVEHFHLVYHSDTRGWYSPCG